MIICPNTPPVSSVKSLFYFTPNQVTASPISNRKHQTCLTLTILHQAASNGSPATANEKDQSRKQQVADVAYYYYSYKHGISQPGLQKNNWGRINLIHTYYNYVHQQNTLHTYLKCPFPQLWKTAHVVPFHKGGDKIYFNNFRPISDLSCLAEVLRSLFDNQIKSNHVLNPHQSGSRAHCSTIAAYSCVTKKNSFLLLTKGGIVAKWTWFCFFR